MVQSAGQLLMGIGKEDECVAPVTEAAAEGLQKIGVRLTLGKPLRNRSGLCGAESTVAS